MLDNFARSVQILITLSGNIEEQLKNVSVLLDNLANKKIVINIESINNLTGSADNAAKSINKISDNAKSTEKHTTSSFDNIKKSIDNVNDGIGNLVNSLAGIAIGGSISGLAWKASAESTLYVEQIERAINSNKKLEISFAELEEFSKQQAEAGEGTRRANIKKYYSILMAGSKYIKGSSTEKLAKADYITDFWFANQELMKGQGFGSAEDLVRSSVRTTGKLTGIRRDALATALGVDPEGKEMGSAKSRMKYMMEKGKGTNMSEALSKRPWEGFATSLKSLKDSIGDSLVWPMNKFVQLLTGAVKLLNSIPGASLFIGLAGGAIALVSTLTLLNGVLSPGISLLKQMVVWTNLHTAAEVKQMVVSKALIVTDWLGLTSKTARTNAIIAETIATAAAANATALNTGATGMEAVALEIDAVANLNTTSAIFGTTAARTAAIGPTMGLTGATTSLAAAEWAALSPLLLLAVPLIAVAGLLYLAETRTHVFSNALDKLSKTEMNKDLIKWLEDVGYWAGYAVDKLGSVTGASIETGLINPIVGPIEGLDNLYKSAKSGDKLGSVMGAGIETGLVGPVVGQIEALDSIYKNFKSGGVLGVLGLGGGEDSSDNNQMLLTSKLFQPISAISGHISTIDETASWVKGLLGTGWDTINGIYSGIVNFPKNAYKFVLDGLTNFGKWIYNGIDYWATWIYNGILFWAGEVRNAFDSVMKDLGIDVQIDKLKTFIDDVRTSIGDLVSDFNTLVSGLTDKFNTLVDDVKITITGLIDKFTTFVSDIKTSISNLIPGRKKGSDSGNAASGSEEGNAASGSEEGFIKFIRETKKGSENYFKYGQLSDETLRAAYREGLTGVPQPHENLTDTYEYDNIVKNAVPEYTKSIQNNTTLNTTNNINPLGDLGAAANKALQDDIAKINEKIGSGEPISSLTPDLGNPSGLAKIAYTGLDSASGGRISSAVDSGKEAVGSAIDSGKEALGSGWNALRDTVGFADGGFVEKTGFALVHEGEPIIPADVASSSRLQNILESIAYGGSSSNTYGDINVRINYTPPSSSTSSNMIVMDRISFEHMVSDIIAKRLRQLNGY